ncbi:MAG: hypothetical protein COV72_02730 [Candidatus Omnitrophica bacterium CG11_big_fil_rev_8_21_14_0_20_42_13]|uniref:PilZ domain-containing protein n=1 Tax=Candidatus Ghiorseimicrobium undicola TaxID=1974746 RepID=A0A2H0LYV3_9BACT|nr:MAG: hypothetical protein COV72_02730 [Candidatus Omnitrophica bacterium CG11_big_fil_rev_8_21_14_0_20_42_13]
MFNRRRQKRLANFDDIISVTYKYGFFSPKKTALSVINIGGGGLKLAIAKKIKKGVLLAIDIMLRGSEHVLPAKGEVVWVKKRENSAQKSYYEIGIQFTKIDPLSICKVYNHFKDRGLKLEIN